MPEKKFTWPFRATVQNHQSFYIPNLFLRLVIDPVPIRAISPSKEL